jgi:hypothetical protein
MDHPFFFSQTSIVFYDETPPFMKTFELSQQPQQPLYYMATPVTSKRFCVKNLFFSSLSEH